MNKKPYIPDWLFQQGFSAHQFAIYCYVAFRGECFESKTKIMAALRMQPKSFYPNLNTLIANGWITKMSKGPGKPVTLRCQQDGVDLSSKPIRKKRKLQTQQDRVVKNMILMDDLQKQMSRHGLQDESTSKSA